MPYAICRQQITVNVYREGPNQTVLMNGPASMDELDACPTGDQEVEGSTPWSATFFLGDLIMKYFLHVHSFSLFC